MKQSIVRWYIVKVKTRTEKEIREYLEKAGFESFQFAQSQNQSLLPCLLFVRASREQVLSLPQAIGLSIDFQYDPTTHQLQYVPDKQMQDFIFLQNFADRTFVLPHPENLRGGEKVRVIGGEFTGIEGEIYRIKGHKRLVVRLAGLVSVAKDYIAKENLARL